MNSYLYKNKRVPLGIKTKLSKKDINPYFQVNKLQKTKHGVSDTVYILDDKYVLKLFENSTLKNIKEEQKLLKLCKDLKVSKLVSKPIKIQNKYALIYKKSKGESLQKIKLKHIKQIGKFLKEFHYKTKNKTSSNKNIFSNKNLKKLMIKSKNVQLLKFFNSLQIELKNDGIIHGDLFCDNALFKNDKISAVIDFSEACEGDFYFDLAVAAIDWCKTDKEIQVLLKSYDTKLGLKKFKRYMRYALIYYATTRFLDKRDYNSLLKRMKKL
jgi:homoserine kinase type II